MLPLMKNYEPHETVAAPAVRSLHETVVVVIINLADLDSAEIVAEVGVRHPEKTLVVVVAALPLQVRRPEIRVV